MSDRELLEAAAKAAGYDIAWHEQEGEGFFQEGPFAYFKPASPHNKRSSDCGEIWNPLTDDSDALRLAVKLGLYLDIETGCGQVDVGPGSAIERFRWDDHAAACAATRRAIVRAAAAIGEAK